MDYNFLDKIILAIDFDNFYVAVERLLDPSLVGKPVGIRQQQILATCSYEARAHGVEKLMGVRDALKLCPNLVIVPGEDLTAYRLHSRRTFELVRDIAGEDKVERLGMDELFVDVTDMVEHSLANAQRGTFILRRNSTAQDATFEYDAQGCVGHDAIDTNKRPDGRLVAATHLAAHIRQRIKADIGLSSSCGIASNKLVAKLVGALNKPDAQTSFPLFRTPDTYSAHIQDFLDRYKVARLQGFGFRTGLILRRELLGEKIPVQVTMGDADKVHGSAFVEHRFQSVNDHSAEPSVAQVAGEDATQVLSVHDVRTRATQAQFATWFGAQLGGKLWGLLHGVDLPGVVPSPLYPKQISVEDSFKGIKMLDEAINEARELTVLLVKRLDGEFLVASPSSQVDSAGNEAAKQKPAPQKDEYARYPTRVRVQLRRSRHGRESKSAVLPVGVFNRQHAVTEYGGEGKEAEEEDVKRRARDLARVAIEPLVKQLWSLGNHSEPVNVINVAMTDMTSEKPTQSVAAYFASATSSSPRSAASVSRAESNSAAQQAEGSAQKRAWFSDVNAKPTRPLTIAQQLSRYAPQQHRKRKKGNGGEAIDFDALLELPNELRDEVCKSYGVDKRELERYVKERERADATRKSNGKSEGEEKGKSKEKVVIILDDSSDDEVSVATFTMPSAQARHASRHALKADDDDDAAAQASKRARLGE